MLKSKMAFILFFVSGFVFAEDPCLKSIVIDERISFISDVNNQFKVKLDPNDLRGWLPGTQLECSPPFKVTYRKGGKTLVFLAVSHVQGDSSLDHETFESIKKIIETERPQGVIVESVSRGLEAEAIRKNCFSARGFLCGEAAFAAYRATQTGAKVVGGEALPEKLNAAILKSSSREQLLAYRSTLTVLTFKSMGIEEEKWSSEFSKHLSRNGISLAQQWSFAEYKKWLRENLNSDPGDINPSWIEPKSDSSASKLQKMVFEIESLREPLILEAIENGANKFDNLLIVYGASHYFKQSPAFEKAYGVPKIDCLGKKN